MRTLLFKNMADELQKLDFDNRGTSITLWSYYSSGLVAQDCKPVTGTVDDLRFRVRLSVGS